MDIHCATTFVSIGWETYPCPCGLNNHLGLTSPQDYYSSWGQHPGGLATLVASLEPATELEVQVHHRISLGGWNDVIGEQ
jgi:hypothetical protein